MCVEERGIAEICIWGEHPMAPSMFSRYHDFPKRMKVVELLERTILSDEAGVAPDELRGYHGVLTGKQT